MRFASRFLLLNLLALHSIAFATELIISNKQPAKCLHYWKNNSQRVPSGKEVGVDVGSSPYGKTGVYECELNISDEDYKDGKYIFIGEVGDSSYFSLRSVNGKVTEQNFVFHGLWPTNYDRWSREPKYTEFIPFVISIDRIWHGAGVYQFDIHYEDIFPGRVGIRSGPITIETLGGLVYRFTIGSPGLIAYLLEVIYFLFATILLLAFASLDKRRRVYLLSTTILSALCVFQLSGITRYYIPLRAGLFLNYALQMVTFSVVSCSFWILIKDFNGYLEKFARFAAFQLVVIILINLLIGTDDAKVYSWLYGIGYVTTGVLGSLLVSWVLLSHRGVFVDSLFPSVMRGWWFFALAIIFAADMINWLALGARYIFLTHFLYFSSVVTIFLFSQVSLRLRSLEYVKRLRAISGRAFSRLGQASESTYDILSDMSAEFARLFGARRVSLLEVETGRARLLGAYGNFKVPYAVFDIDPKSIISKLQATGTTQNGIGPGISSGQEAGQYWVIPIYSDGRLCGAICLTDFVDGFMMPFFEQRIEDFRDEVQSCVNYLFSRRDRLAYQSIVQIERERLNPLLIQTEEHLLKNFLVSEVQDSYSFLMGDLVGSVALREAFGNLAVDGAIRACLTELWEKHKQVGAIIDIREGDSFSVSVPRLVTDSGERTHRDRCLELLTDWNRSDGRFMELAKLNGIQSEFSFRVVMAVAVASNTEKGLKRFDYDANPSKDTAARVLKEICLPSECIVVGKDTVSRIAPGRVLALEPKRLRGKSISTDLFILKKPDSPVERLSA